jgi:hypothetical protein
MDPPQRTPVSDVQANAVRPPHDTVLRGPSGILIEEQDVTQVLVPEQPGAAEWRGGPKVGELYEFRFSVAGDPESVQRMQFVGYAAHTARYVFGKRN